MIQMVEKVIQLKKFEPTNYPLKTTETIEATPSLRVKQKVQV